MKKRIKIVLVVTTIVALPLMGAGQQSKSEEKSLLVDFIEYCKTCENLRQVDPNKDYTQATLHELKNAARFYVGDGKDGPTGIEQITRPIAAKNSGIYDLQGRRVSGKPQAGMYIVNGKKMMIK